MHAASRMRASPETASPKPNSMQHCRPHPNTFVCPVAGQPKPTQPQLADRRGCTRTSVPDDLGQRRMHTCTHARYESAQPRCHRRQSTTTVLRALWGRADRSRCGRIAGYGSLKRCCSLGAAAPRAHRANPPHVPPMAHCLPAPPFLTALTAFGYRIAVAEVYLPLPPRAPPECRCPMPPKATDIKSTAPGRV